MTYTEAVLAALALVLAIDLFVLRTRLVTRGVFWATYPILLFFQFLSNGILTARDIVRYDPAAIVGWRLFHAPVEDIAFGFALILGTLSLWVWWGRRGVQSTPRPGGRRPERATPDQASPDQARRPT